MKLDEFNSLLSDELPQEVLEKNIHQLLTGGIERENYFVLTNVLDKYPDAINKVDPETHLTALAYAVIPRKQVLDRERQIHTTAPIKYNLINFLLDRGADANIRIPEYNNRTIIDIFSTHKYDETPERVALYNRMKEQIPDYESEPEDVEEYGIKYKFIIFSHGRLRDMEKPMTYDCPFRSVRYAVENQCRMYLNTFEQYALIDNVCEGRYKLTERIRPTPPPRDVRSRADLLPKITEQHHLSISFGGSPSQRALMGIYLCDMVEGSRQRRVTKLYTCDELERMFGGKTAFSLATICKLLYERHIEHLARDPRHPLISWRNCELNIFSCRGTRGEETPIVTPMTKYRRSVLESELPDDYDPSAPPTKRQKIGGYRRRSSNKKIRKKTRKNRRKKIKSLTNI